MTTTASIPSLAGRGNLSPFEAKVADLAVEGFGNKDIGQHLGIPEQTVKNHLLRVYRKLRVDNRVSLVRYAMGVLTSNGTSPVPSAKAG